MNYPYFLHHLESISRRPRNLLIALTADAKLGSFVEGLKKQIWFEAVSTHHQIYRALILRITSEKANKTPQAAFRAW